MIIKKKQESRRKRKNQLTMKKETYSNFHVMYATKKRSRRLLQKFLKSMQILFKGYQNDRGH